MFVPDTSSGGSEAKTLQNAAQKVLAGEIAKRATRLSEAPDDQFVLAADGTLRWTGAAVGKLVAGEEVLRPRVRIIADEHLSGAPREAVDTRLDRWLKSHIEKLLGPLFALSGAADITGMRAASRSTGRGAGDKAAACCRGSEGPEQPERASLRKYGVRFAYHPSAALLKRTARARGQLWALALMGRRPRA
jgi:ATP-dependent RNA helicase SUPV3L1/SUV3